MMIVKQFSRNLTRGQNSGTRSTYHAEQNHDEHRRIYHLHSSEQQKTAKLHGVDCSESVYTRALISNPSVYLPISYQLSKIVYWIFFF
jgi:hypothetical protein